MRLFVSVDLDDDLAAGVERVQEPLSDASGLRLTDPEQAHITLKFLGDTDPERVPALGDELRQAVEESGVEPFRAEFGGLGVFPSLEYISVVWLGVREGGEAFTRLHEDEFTPHVTLARMDHSGGKDLVRDIVRNRDPDVGAMTVESIRLTESELTPSGPEYSTVEEFDLR
ncbi:RNA 2',3'-cyclic phosphodiesterase [Halobacteriales archaeon QH_7_66_37]|nr:MAG: RNA 2',3'-cyclic phosphodiesterase [Halobacteriales archaeon QH_7_66_37]